MVPALPRPTDNPTIPALLVRSGPLPAASGPRDRARQRLLLVEPERHRLSDHLSSELPQLLSPKDLVVVNDAATLPASLFAADGSFEVRLVGRTTPRTFTALLFGPGDHRTPTENRLAAPSYKVGTRLDFGVLAATVEGVDERSPRLIALRFDHQGAALYQALYRVARPIQYAHVRSEVALWDVQSAFASRPWAFEAPSAGFALSFDVLQRLRARGIEVMPLTHAAGVSSTGSSALDRRLPFPEHYDLPASTVDAVVATQRAGGRVVAVGTTVVRALESNLATFGELRAGTNQATLVLGAADELRVVDAVLTGLHEPGTSHFELLRAFAPLSVLQSAHRHLLHAGYLGHEFGDALLVLGDRGSQAR